MASFEKLEGNQVKLTMSIPAADFEKAIELREQVAKLEKRLNALKTKKTGRTG